jgi:hypothetical protein
LRAQYQSYTLEEAEKARKERAKEEDPAVPRDYAKPE